MKHRGINTPHLAIQYEMFVDFPVFITASPTLHESKVIRREVPTVTNGFPNKPSQTVDVEP